MAGRRELAEIFRETQEETRRVARQLPRLRLAIEGSRRCDVLPPPQFAPERVGRPRIEVRNLDILAVAKALADEHPEDGVCIVNPASELKAGGGVKGGASALEESLCRRTTLYAHLARHAYPIEGGIYARDVLVLRDAQYAFLAFDQRFWVDVASVPGVRRPALDRAGRMSAYDAARLRDKIRLILRMCERRHLVLCALGCGAFRNPPWDVVAAFNDVLDEDEFNSGKFATLTFAVIDSGATRNFELFDQHIKR